LKWALDGRSLDQVFLVGDVVRAKAAAWDPDRLVWEFELLAAPKAQAALILMENETGRVKAMVGGRSFAESQFNRAVQAKRQPGSAFKPFVYTAAVDTGYTQASNINDVEVTYPDGDDDWTPQNYGRSHGGPTTLYRGLTKSVNVVAVRLMERVGVDQVIGYARRMGIESDLGPHLSLALGSCEVSLLEMVRAYSVFANLGVRVDPMFITRIEKRYTGEAVEFLPRRREVLSPQTAYIVLDMLRGVVREGTGRRVAALDRPVAGKTGTTNDLADAWFIGFTPQYTCGVWVGRDVRESLGPGEQGGRTAAPIFLDFMKQALADVPPADFAVPPGVVQKSIPRTVYQDGQAVTRTARYWFKQGEIGPGPLSEGPYSEQIPDQLADVDFYAPSSVQPPTRRGRTQSYQSLTPRRRD
jgi:penicillin-binding protein 1A